LESVEISVGARQVSGEIPPLGAEIGMWAVIFGKLEGAGLQGAREGRVWNTSQNLGDTQRCLHLWSLPRSPAAVDENGSGEERQ
jgi:hypothetical protein